MNYQQYAEYARMKELPEGLDALCEAYTPDGCDTLLDRTFFISALRKAGADDAAMREMLDALAAIESDPKLLAFSRFLASDLCAARNRCDCDNYLSLEPGCLSGMPKKLYALVMMVACMERSMEMLAKRGVPSEHYMDIPYKPLRAQVQKLDRGDTVIADFPWDLNFYTCSIFLMDRFYFIPFRYGEAPVFYRNADTNAVTALWQEGDRVRRDGQLDGVNGVTDAQAFETTWCEDERTVTAYPVLPQGLIGQSPVTLNKAVWKATLPEDSLLLAFHIPGGEGYEPDRVRHSMLLALEFFAKYFPELDIRGFWSESWLYDPGLRAILPPHSRIIRVQKQFYCYPTMEGDDQTKLEVFHTKQPDMSAQGKTSLERKLLESWRAGVRFHGTGMVVLRPETELIGREPYQATETEG